MGSTATTVSISGAGFTPVTTVALNGTQLPTSYVSATSVTAKMVPSASLGSPGKFSVTASNPAPGGGTSVGSAEFDVTGGTLSITIVDLPSGTNGNVTLGAPGSAPTQITQTSSLVLPVGVYALTANSVVVGGNTYNAMLPTQAVNVANGATTAVTVDYKNIVPPTTKVLDSPAMASLSISTDGQTLTMSATSPVAQSLAVGDVVVVPPTTATGVAPKGMLRKVLTASNDGPQRSSDRPFNLRLCLTRFCGLAFKYRDN